MTPTWVLDRNIFNEGAYEAMLAHFVASGIPHHVVRVVPFVHTLEAPPPVISGPVVCYGAVGIKKVAETLGWKPGLWESEGFDEATCRDALGDLYLNADAVRMPMSAVAEWSASRGLKELFFIKPDVDGKIFSGEVMTGVEFIEWRTRLINVDWLKGDDPLVVISSPKRIEREWRCVVVDGKISACSLYKVGSAMRQASEMPTMVQYTARKAMKLHSPAPIFVIDVAEIANGDFKVIEYNTFNHSGFYAADVGKIIDDVNAFVALN